LYLELTPDQADFMGSSEATLFELDEYLVGAQRTLGELKGRLEEAGEDVDAEMDNLASILTPRQKAKLMMWMCKNKACLRMLDELWKQTFPVGGGK